MTEKTYVLRTYSRKVTVRAKDEDEARGKASEILDKRMIKSGSEPPVGHTFVRVDVKEAAIQ